MIHYPIGMTFVGVEIFDNFFDDDLGRSIFLALGIFRGEVRLYL